MSHVPTPFSRETLDVSEKCYSEVTNTGYIILYYIILYYIILYYIILLQYIPICYSDLTAPTSWRRYYLKGCGY